MDNDGMSFDAHSAMDYSHDGAIYEYDERNGHGSESS